MFNDYSYQIVILVIILIVFFRKLIRVIANINWIRILNLKRKIIHFEKVKVLKPLIRKCNFSPKKRFGKKLMDLQTEFNSFSFGPVIGKGKGSEYSIRQSMGELRQLLVD